MTVLRLYTQENTAVPLLPTVPKLWHLLAPNNTTAYIAESERLFAVDGERSDYGTTLNSLTTTFKTDRIYPLALTTRLMLATVLKQDVYGLKLAAVFLTDRTTGKVVNHSGLERKFKHLHSEVAVRRLQALLLKHNLLISILQFNLVGTPTTVSLHRSGIAEVSTDNKKTQQTVISLLDAYHQLIH